VHVDSCGAVPRGRELCGTSAAVYSVGSLSWIRCCGCPVIVRMAAEKSDAAMRCDAMRCDAMRCDAMR
jgi:hypothetical protein